MRSSFSLTGNPYFIFELAKKMTRSISYKIKKKMRCSAGPGRHSFIEVTCPSSNKTRRRRVS
jgi:hypothetical protein